MVPLDSIEAVRELGGASNPRRIQTLNYAGSLRSRKSSLTWIKWTAVAVSILLIAFYAASLFSQPSRDHSPRVECANHLRMIGLACMMYANANGDRLPDSLNEVLLTQDITSDSFICPESKDTRATGPTTAAVAANLTAGGHLSYIYVGKGLSSTAPPNTVLAYEPLTNHGGAGMEVLYVDGHVEWQDAKAAMKIVAELRAGYNPPRPGH